MEADLRVAGPPCQDVSPAGLHQGCANPSGRGRLMAAALLYIQEMRPKMFILEEVPQIITAERAQFYREVLQQLRATDAYVITDAVLDAQDHGIPQHRERCFIIGVRKDCRQHPLYMPPLLAPPCRWVGSWIRGGGGDPKREPAGKGAQEIVTEARRRLGAAAEKDDRILDTDAPRGWGGRPMRIVDV